jgi:hypothetical protein
LFDGINDNAFVVSCLFLPEPSHLPGDHTKFLVSPIRIAKPLYSLANRFSSQSAFSEIQKPFAAARMQDAPAVVATIETCLCCQTEETALIHSRIHVNVGKFGSIPLKDHHFGSIPLLSHLHVGLHESMTCGVHGIYLKFGSFNGIDPIVPTMFAYNDRTCFVCVRLCCIV